MPDMGQEVLGFGINRGVGMAASALGSRIPLPSFYNAESPNHFSDSELMQILHGNGRAATHFGARTAGSIAGGMIAGPLGAMAGGYLLPHFANLIQGNGWNGNSRPDPTGTVTVGNINDTSGFGGQVQQIDPWSGAPMPQFGPMQSGYQGLPPDSTPSDGSFPDFSQYSAPLFQAPMSHQDRIDYRDNLGMNGAGQSANYGISPMTANGEQMIVGDNGFDPNGRYMFNRADGGG